MAVSSVDGRKLENCKIQWLNGFISEPNKTNHSEKDWPKSEIILYK